MTAKICIVPTIDALLGRIAALDPEKKSIVFCEDRLTMEAERVLAKKYGAVFQITVTTFARFLGKAKEKTLTKQGSVLVIGTIAAKNGQKLRCFGKNPSGCAGRLYETIAQLRAALIQPEKLEAAAEGAPQMLADKLQDIALVYREYLEFLSGGYLDESSILALLPQALRERSLQDTHVVFAGFSSFTRQAAEGIFAALSCAKSVTGMFIGGKEDFYTNEAANLFEKYCLSAGAKTEKEFFPSDRIAEAETLRKGLFNPVLPQTPQKTDRVHLFEAADGDDEISFIAAMLRREVARGVRFRDVALYLPDAKKYGVLLEKWFSDYKIPYYADEKRSLSLHPLVKFIESWFRILSDGFEPSDVDAFVSNVFFGFDRPSRDAYRNYLLKFANYRGGAKREIKASADASGEKKGKTRTGEDPLLLIAPREKLLAAFDGAQTSMEGGEYCRCIRRLLDLFKCETTQKEVADKLSGQGLLAESSYFARGAESVLRVLGEAESLSGKTKMRAEEFGAVLSEAFSALEISLVPQYLDAVFVGTLSESKAAGTKIVFAAGLTADVPSVNPDTALLSDKDIDRLRTLKVEIEPKVREVNARLKENAALALCSFGERLYMSYPVSFGGEACRRGEIVQTARALFCGEGGKPLSVLTRAALERAQRTSGAAYARYLASVASERVPAVRELLVCADAYRRGRGDFSAHSGVYAALKERGEAPSQLLFERAEPATCIPVAAETAFRGKQTVSPTFIEGYFQCPYRNFAERGLLLREREEASVRAADTGDFMHAILQKLAENIDGIASVEACGEFVRREAEALLAEPPYCYLKDTGQGAFCADSLVREAVLIGQNVFEQITCSDFSVFAAEKQFGYPDSLFPAIPLLSGKRKVSLAGKIDRVDRCGDYTRVVDYKTGAVDGSAENYYTGRKVQLQLYLSAASRGARAAGAYYFPAKVSYGEPGENPFRMQGFTLDDDEVVRMSDKAVEEGQKSRFIDAYYKKKNKKSMGEEDFDAFIAYSVLVAQNCARETDMGCIAASPYDGACEYCPYGGLCGYDKSAGVRRERQVTGEEIVRIVRERRGER